MRISIRHQITWMVGVNYYLDIICKTHKGNYYLVGIYMFSREIGIFGSNINFIILLTTIGSAL